ncbi:HAD family hydrolase [Ferroacidibacillus organovorans]|uniref:HAD family hydrolase n=1 Tax=Ferroacidibacillus organovorans TaxID=1765683 RepID=A0A101XTW6_9BACL|nr:YqeG family HAD IIIA-type phosphatase [Ferroacidibacillus organovorans]KUO97487.1 HAD family hydrolase [Ferroacidibacillus organovorans]
MLSSLKPNEYVTSIYHIDVKALADRGIRGILTDLDNTLVAWNSPQATPKLVAWLSHVKNLGFRVMILSNNEEARVRSFAEPLGIPCIAPARKPRTVNFHKALAQMNVSAGETAMVGDQLFTDVLGGNRAGLYTILVQPIHSKEWIGTKLNRIAERFVLARLPSPSGQKEYTWDEVRREDVLQDE